MQPRETRPFWPQICVPSIGGGTHLLHQERLKSPNQGSKQGLRHPYPVTAYLCCSYLFPCIFFAICLNYERFEEVDNDM